MIVGAFRAGPGEPRGHGARCPPMDKTASSTSRTAGANWIDRLSRHRTGLAAISAAESTVVPIPLETVIAPLMVGHPRRALGIALWVWLGCLAGASLFYLADRKSVV